jgi:P pilus assembly chaperone PapD
MFQKRMSCIALSLMSLFAWGTQSANAIEISVGPPRFELNINSNNTRSNSITITNFSNQPTSMRAYVRNWIMNDKNELEDAPSDEKTLDQWIIFTPSKFTIPPGGTQTIRFAVRPKIKPAPGEYRAVIYFEEAPSDNLKPGSINTVTRVGVAVYAYAGEIKRIGTINSVTVDAKPNSIKAIFNVSNHGNAHIRINGQYAIWRAASYPGAKATQPIQAVNNPTTKLPANVVQAGELNSPPVLPNNHRQLALPLPLTSKLPPGNYILDVHANLSGTGIDKGIPFTIPVSNVSQTAPKPANFLAK